MVQVEVLPTRLERAQSAEIALAVVFGALFALSPLSSGSRIAISVAMGSAFGLVLYAYRWLASRAAAADVPQAQTSATPLALSRPKVAITSGLFVALFLPTWIGLYPWFTESVWRNGHGLMLPLLILAVSRIAIRRHANLPADGTAWGLVLLLPGLVLAILDSGVSSLYFAVAGMPLVAAGLILIFLGPAWAKALAVPTGLLLFFMPIPSGFASSLGLDIATSICTSWMLDMTGHTVVREGVLFQVDASMAYGISLRCSGFSIFYGAVALSIALGAVVGSWRRAAVLSVLALPLTYVMNGARVASLIIFCQWRGIDPSETMLHGISGIGAYLGVMAIVLLLAGRKARLTLVAQ